MQMGVLHVPETIQASFALARRNFVRLEPRRPRETHLRSEEPYRANRIGCFSSDVSGNCGAPPAARSNSRYRGLAVRAEPAPSDRPQPNFRVRSRRLVSQAESIRSLLRTPGVAALGMTDEKRLFEVVKAAERGEEVALPLLIRTLIALDWVASAERWGVLKAPCTSAPAGGPLRPRPTSQAEG